MNRIVSSWLLASATLLAIVTAAAAGALPSSWVYPSATGNLLYAADTNGVRINDFSDCGYRRGEVALPDLNRLVEENRWLWVSGRAGDDTTLIQAALDWVGLLQPNSHGFRGVVQLDAGEYQLSNTVRITKSGVVLKGAGSSLTSGTRLRATFRAAVDFIAVSGWAGPVEVAGSETQFAETLVPAATRTFRVRRVAGFQPGDTVMVRRVATPAWLRATDMEILNNDTGVNADWITPYDSTGAYERRVTRIEGDWITVDAPVPQTFEARYGGGTIRRVTTEGRLENCGVEDLACTFDVYTTDDEKHPAAAVLVANATDVWMRNVVASGYISSCASVGGSSRCITVAECQMLNPFNSGHHSRYAFLLARDAAYVLVRDCYSENSRHDYILANVVPGPNAFVRCRTSESDDDTGPHQRWATGALFDNVSVDGSGSFIYTDGQLNVQNRGRSGGGNDAHGWVGGYMVVWNCRADAGFRVRNPPTARNWLIGSDGDIKSSMRGCWYDDFWWDGGCWAVGADPEGTYDQSGPGADGVQLRSLYYAQLQQRLKWPGSEFREYRLGDIDQLLFNPGGVEQAPVDTNWLAQVRGISGGQLVSSQFDGPSPSLWRAFTFNFPLAPNERVVAASITLGLHFSEDFTTPPASERLYLDRTTGSVDFGSIGWNPAKLGTSSHTVEVSPGLLQDGQLNVALGRHTSVDFATLHLQVAPKLVTIDSTRIAEADTYVRGGSYDDQNFGQQTELEVKTDSEGGFSRKSALRWDLSGSTGELVDAKVRLYCAFAGQAGNEQSASLIRNDGWSETGLTWNNYPSLAIDPPFAYWVPVAGRFVEFTVTPQALEALAGDRLLSLSIASVQDWGAAGGVNYASREDANPLHRPQLVLRVGNQPPTITSVTNVVMHEAETLVLGVIVQDAETPATNLVLTATSSNPFALGETNITVRGNRPDLIVLRGANRTITLHPASGQLGVAQITLSVSDGAQTTSTSFLVNVDCTNSAPTISALAGHTMAANTSLEIQFTIGDRCTYLLSQLSVTASAANRALFPDGTLQILPPTGLGSQFSGTRYLRLTPALGESGSSTITVAVSDGFFTTARSFAVTVTPGSDLPDEFAIVSPLDGDRVRPGVPLSITAYAPAAPGFGRTRPLVEFYVDQKHLGTAAVQPYTVNWTSPPAGRHVLWAYLTNSSGSMTSPPVTITVSADAVPRPQLITVNQSKGKFLVWPSWMGEFTLESTAEIGPRASWSPVQDTPKASDGLWVLPLPVSDERRFFRLTSP